VLEGAKRVDISKSFERNRPQLDCHITPDRNLNYLPVFEQLILDAAAAVKSGIGRTVRRQCECATVFELLE